MSSKIFRLLFGRHQGDLFEDMGGRRLLGNEHQLQMVNDPVHDAMLGTAICFCSMSKLNVEFKWSHNMQR